MAQRKAKALKRGDLIALIAPASAPIAEERVTKAVQYFEQLGYSVLLGKNIYHTHGFLSAPDNERLDDLHAMFRHPKVRAIFFIRGGYGSIRLLPQVNYDLIKKHPKILVGYSDATSLISAIYKKTGLRSMFFGPMPGVDIWNGFDPFAEEQFWRALTSTKAVGVLPMNADEGVLLNPVKSNKNISCSGRLIGGNLTVFSSIVGTPFLPAIKNRILFFEDIDEKPYRVDRYLAQLNALGAIEDARAILLGQFAGCEADAGAKSLTIAEVFYDYFGKLKIPVLQNLPSGHVRRQWTLPFGATYELSINDKKTTLSVIESVLS